MLDQGAQTVGVVHRFAPLALASRENSTVTPRLRLAKVRSRIRVIRIHLSTARREQRRRGYCAGCLLHQVGFGVFSFCIRIFECRISELCQQGHILFVTKDSIPRQPNGMSSSEETGKQVSVLQCIIFLNTHFGVDNIGNSHSSIRVVAWVSFGGCCLEMSV